jgi:hypothetical protein
LVPHVVCDPAAPGGQLNTLIGLITFDKARIGLQGPDGGYAPAPWSLATITVGGESISTPGSAQLPIRHTAPPPYNKTIHWWFYNAQSRHLLNGVIPATDNDFVRFDWCTTIRQTGQTTLNGVPGYIIFASDEVDRGDLVRDAVVPSIALYGHAYMIRGNWESQAFIPVLPNPMYALNRDGSVFVKNVTKREGYPAFTRLVSGIDFTQTVGPAPTLQRDVYMRYFLDPALATENRMVFWFNFNAGAYDSPARAGALGYLNTASLVRGPDAAGETYDSEQVYRNSFSVPLPDELNILVSYPPGVLTGPKFPGMVHTETEAYSGATVVNTGIVRFGIPEAVAIAVNPPDTNSGVPFVASGVSFNMLGLGAGVNAAQLQTEMSTQGPAY